MGRSRKSDERAKLLSRIDELEVRVKLLEARLRAVGAQARAPQRELSARSRVARRARARPRCPGCLLEVPPGRRGETCVWCGFRFEVVRPITFKR